MTTLAKLKKFGKRFFIPEMTSRGFTHSKSFEFYLLENSIYKFVVPDVTRGGHARFNVFCWVPELQQDYDMSQFPSGIVVTNGGELSEDGIDISSYFWRIENEKQICECFREVLRLIDVHVLPWFRSIESRQDLLAALFEDERERPEYQDMVYRVLRNS